MSKGYIYANFDKKGDKKDTDYTVDYTLQILDKALISGIEFQTEVEKYVDKAGNEYSSKVNEVDSIYTKTIKISKEVFHKMFGEEGKIQILDTKGTKIAEISEKLEADKNGNYIVNIFEAKINEIVVKTTQPIAEGNIEIAIEKAIAGNQEYSKQQIQEYEKIMIDKDSKTSIKLTEPVSKAEISIGTQNLSTIVENKDVEIRVVLDTSSNKNALYKNPTLQIVMPENIEKIDIKSIDLLLEDELKIKETKVVEQNGRKVILVTLTGTQTKYMDNGTSQQKEQENVISKGANIVIKSNITFQKLAPSASSNIYLYYTNENTDLFEKYYQNPKTKARSMSNSTPIGLATTRIEITAPNGVVAENHINGYKNNENISNTTAEKQTQNIDAYAAEREVTIGGTIVNNYDNSIENVFVLGRIPFSGNKAIDTTNDLGSNFTIAMKNKLTTSGIDSSKIRVYYSTNGEATKDLMNSSNGWVAEPTNLAQVKSYLIVISGELAKGTQVNFDYKASLPANLGYNKEAYTSYKVYYDNNMPDATLGETKVAGIVGLVTGQGPELQVSVSSKMSTVREEQIVRMTATIKNNGGLTAQNAKLFITAPEGTVHTEIPEGSTNYLDSKEKDKTISLGDIKAGETITRDYELRIEKGKKIVEVIDDAETGKKHTEERNEYPGDKDIINIVRVSAENMSNEISSQAYNLKVIKGDLSIINEPNANETEVFRSGDRVQYKVIVSNISYDKDLNNVTLKIKLPNGVKINQFYCSDSIFFENKETDNIIINGNDILVNLGKLQSYNKYFEDIKENLPSPEEDDEGEHEIDISKIELRQITYIFMELELTNFSGEHEFLMEATADEIETHYSNSKKLLAEAVSLKIEQKALDNQYVKEGSEYTYHFTVENTSKVASVFNVIEMPIPDGLSVVKSQYTYQGETKPSSSVRDGKLTINIRNIAPGEKIQIDVTVKANLLPDKNDKEVITMATVSAQGVPAVASNKVKAIIEYDENLHKVEGPDNPSGGDNPGGDITGSYKIAGTAWIDENKDGKRDDTEEVLAGVQVILLYKSNSQVVKDVTTGAEKITTTNESGKYEFTNLVPDEYLVLFLYDAGKYSITDYQKEGVAESINSDATGMKIILNGEQRQAGVSNTIKITDNHIRDIDIGLFIAEKFDLRLDKYISKITVTTPSSGTKVYHYNNSKLTKREIASKDVGNSQLVAEYKIVVTNEGQVDGYVKKIIDYLPEDAKFSSELNKDWYISDNNGTVYNTALENEKIEPGQSKEVKLILSFNITSKNIGKMINNNAEIYESYNELGLEDIDSIPANMLESEDDMSNADIMVAVATGKVIIYTTFTLAVAGLLGFGIYEIKKRVLVEKKD